ncbi:hypothetical protein [Lentzea sp. E54]|uniref:hypothetical protein n=1 Tax=Lentzea xerophila TaxID=3435883 RepID=UPI003DA57779
MKLDTISELSTELQPATVHQYLAANEWQLELEVPHVKEIWRLGDDARIMLPLATNYADFVPRFRDTLFMLADVYDWDADELIQKILATRADLFYVRLDQVMTDGTLPFRQAHDALESLYKMMKAAATTAYDPTHSHRGKRSSTVNEFLDDDIRLGHTKRGSFVFTVVARLGEPAPTQAAGTPDIIFPRLVMQTLATGLHTAKRLSLEPDPQVIERAAEHGLSANLVASLQELTDTGTLRELDLSFDWSTSLPAPEVPASRIVVDRDAMAGLPRVRERLIRSEEPPRMETLIGRVRSLTREEEDDQEETTIILSAEVNGRSRKVHVPLSGQDYEWAIYAHREKLPFTVTGELAFEKRAWRLGGPITVDASFLEHHRSQ